jgi:hypothetical protein
MRLQWSDIRFQSNDAAEGDYDEIRRNNEKLMLEGRFFWYSST